MAAAPRRRKLIGQRRRADDEGDDDGPEALDLLDDDSLTEGSLSDDNDAAGNSDTSNIDEASPTSPDLRKSTGNGAAKAGPRKPAPSLEMGTTSTKAAQQAISDTDIMLNGLSISDEAQPLPEIDFDDINDSASKSEAPIVVSSSSAAPPNKRETPYERQRREHDLYRQKRDEDPAFVPNRGAFFMHDHRGTGPSANGFRPFARGGRGRGGGRGGGGIGGPFAPMHQLYTPSDPTTNAPWSHDMHEAVTEPAPPRYAARHVHDQDGPPNGTGFIPTCPPNREPINRTMSEAKVTGRLTIRAFVPPMKNGVEFRERAVTQYTKLPDHRPPLRRDKPVRISLPDHPPRYIYPAVDRSFIFIPRAQRPNQRARGKPRSGMGSVSGFSRRTSVYGGSYYGGSMYSPSIAMSRRSSIAPDMGRDFLISPTGSTISRPPMPVDVPRPVVRLPPVARPDQVMPAPAPAPVPINLDSISSAGQAERPAPVAEPSISELPPPRTHPLPQKPTFQENQPNTIPMHQPRPQKAVSVETIESPTMSMNPPRPPFQQAFHQQMPNQVSNTLASDAHSRKPSYPSHSTGTPLSQIPESAIFAAPFQPNAYPQQQGGFYGQPYQMMQPHQGYYYNQPYGGSMNPPTAAPSFVPGEQQAAHPTFNQHDPRESAGTQTNGQGTHNPNLVAQRMNGMVYYFDPSQIPAASTYPAYSGPPQGFVPGVGMGGDMVAPSPDGFYYPQPAPGMMYYPQ